MSPQPHADRVRLRRGWWLPAALMALAPKCLLCVLAYAGLAGVLGVGGPEICGVPAGTAAQWTSWVLPVGFAGAGLLVRSGRSA